MNASAVLLFALILIGIIVVYQTQFGAPDTGGATDVAGDVAGDIVNNAPSPEEAADRTASFTNWASGYPLALGALACIAVLAYLWRKHKIIVVVVATILVTIVITAQA